MTNLHRLAGSVAVATVVSLFAFQSPWRMQSGPISSHWFPQYDFDPATFAKPPVEFRPYARWWWPGNDVIKTELQREINLFADNGFGGVEIQTLALGLNRSSPEVSARALSWDTPAYYDNLKAVLEEARTRGLTVDLTDGSGWPPGGSFLDPQDGFLTLQSATQAIKGGESLTLALPTIPSKTGVPPRLVSVLAAKVVATRSGENPNIVSLENTAPLVLTAQVRNDTLRCQLPAGDWKLIALWSRPVVSKP